MEYTRLGNSGLQVSRLCLGMMTFGSPKWQGWVLDEQASRPIIRRALELGVNFFDTANVYSSGVSEEITGRVLLEHAPRDEVVIATKVYYRTRPGPNGDGLSRKHIMQAVDDSLRRLGTDYIDLYQIHFWDDNTPIEETLEALHDIVKAGKARYIGASTTNAWKFATALYKADQHGWTRFVSMQNYYSLVYREDEREMNPLCNAEGIGLIPWSPLARGFLAGKRPRNGQGPTERARTDAVSGEQMGRIEADYDVLDALLALATERDVQPAQLAIAWLLHKPGMTAPIVGTTKIEQLEALAAATSLHLSPDEMARLESAYVPHKAGF